MEIKIKVINEEIAKSEISSISGKINEDNEIIDMIKMIGIKTGREFSLIIKNGTN